MAMLNNQMVYIYIYIWFPYFDGDLPMFHHRKKPLQENCLQRLGTLQLLARNLAALRPRKGGGKGGAKAYGTLGEIWGLAEQIYGFFFGHHLRESTIFNFTDLSCFRIFDW